MWDILCWSALQFPMEAWLSRARGIQSSCFLLSFSLSFLRDLDRLSARSPLPKLEFNLNISYFPRLRDSTLGFFLMRKRKMYEI